MPNKKIYYRRLNKMDQLGRKLVKEIEVLEKILKPYCFLSQEELFNYCLSNLDSKLKNKPLRAYFSTAVYEYLNHYPTWQDAFSQFDQRLFTEKLPFLFEMVIGVQYFHNFILDEKLDSKDNFSPKANQYLIASNILKELSFCYIEQEILPLLSVNPISSQGIDFRTRIRDLYLCVDWGQYLDKEHNHHEAWQENAKIKVFDQSFFFDNMAEKAIDEILSSAKVLVPGKELFLESYFRRIYYSNVYFFRCIVETIARFVGMETDSLSQTLTCFSIKYGFMLQIINDYADFAYSDVEIERELLRTAGKKQTDFFADLYNFNITLPLIFHLQQGHKRKIETYLETQQKDRTLFESYPNQIKVEIVSSGAIHECVDLSRKLSMSAREELPKDGNPMAPYLEDLCDMAFDNKFYKVFNP